MIRWFLFIFLIITITSCAWNKSDFAKTKEDDLVHVFEIENEELKKFVVKEKKVEKIDVLKEINTIIGEPKKDKTKNAQKKKTRPKKKTLKKVDPIVTPKKVKEEEVKKESFSYPEGHPAKYQEYDQVSKKIWSQFKPNLQVGEVIELDVKYFGVTAGKVQMRVLPLKEIDNKKVYHLNIKLVSAPFYRVIYSLDDSIDLFIDKETFRPVKYSLIQRESKQRVDDLQIFDLKKLETHFWYKREKDDKIKKENKKEFIPRYFLDSVSPLYFTRGLPLNLGDEYKFPIITRAKLWILKMKVAKIEVIEIHNKKIKAIKINAETNFPGVLKKRGDIVFWYSADEKRQLLKFEAKVKIGTIEGIVSAKKK